MEIAAALFRRVRGLSLSAEDATDAVDQLRQDTDTVFDVTEVTETVALTAIALAERHGLRGYDCVQLASALLTQGERAAANLSPLTLLSADTELNAAAVTEGLTVDNPTEHRAEQ